MTNAFEIPKKSNIVDENRMYFLRKPRKVHQNMSPLFLLGSSTHPRPETMEKPREETKTKRRP
jgi:hypothetical protein